MNIKSTVYSEIIKLTNKCSCGVNINKSLLLNGITKNIFDTFINNLQITFNINLDDINEELILRDLINIIEQKISV